MRESETPSRGIDSRPRSNRLMDIGREVKCTSLWASYRP